MSTKLKESFIDLCVQGKALPEDIDDFVDRWHDGGGDGELYEYLGMTWEEHSHWILHPESIFEIVEVRKSQTCLPHTEVQRK